MKDDTTKLVGTLLLGGLMGAAIALLLAPKSGRETREDILRATRRAKDDTVDINWDALHDVND